MLGQLWLPFKFFMKNNNLFLSDYQIDFSQQLCQETDLAVYQCS